MSVSLTKGQKVSLNKSDGTRLTRIRMGLSWSLRGTTQESIEKPEKKSWLSRRREQVSELRSAPVDIDLDASALMFTGQKECVEIVSYSSKKSQNGSVRLLGDDTSGTNPQGIDDNESILVALTKVDPHVQTIVFVVTSYRGSFIDVDVSRCRLVDEDTSTEFGSYVMTGKNHQTAIIMAKVSRIAGPSGGWTVEMIGEPCVGKVAGDVVRDAARFL